LKSLSTFVLPAMSLQAFFWIKKEELGRHFVNNVVDDPLFKRQKRLNELFNLNKSYNIHKDMTLSRC
jgi:hypothetical protein